MTGSRRAILIGLASLAIGACSSQVPIDTAPTGGNLEYVRQFTSIDTDGKGTITLDQARAYYDRRFNELDINRDGFLDATEIAPMLPLMQARSPEELVKKLDNDADGKISRKEFQIITNWLFQRARSGSSLSLAEAGQPQQRPLLDAPGGPGGGPPGKGGSGGGGRGGAPG